MGNRTVKLAPKILAPIVILALVTITLIAVAVNAQRNVHDSTDLALAAGRQLTHASEIRALSRAIQRDTLNMLATTLLERETIDATEFETLYSQPAAA